MREFIFLDTPPPISKEEFLNLPNGDAAKTVHIFWKNNAKGVGAKTNKQQK